MGLVTPQQSSPGETIEAADVNTPVNQIAAVINGSIETVNLADSSVTTAKVADGAITNAKLDTAAGGIGAAWQSWTPTYTNVTNVTTQYAKYIKVGKTVKFRIQFNLTGTSAVSGVIGFSLPVAANSELSDANDFPDTTGQLVDATGFRWNPAVAFGSTSRLDIFYWNSSAQIANTSSTAPFTWANNDLIAISGSYEAA